MSKLLCIEVDGTVRDVDDGYTSLREAIGDTITFVFVDTRLGVFVDDNGMISAKALNHAASMAAGRALYGTAVLCAGNPDEEGNSVPLAPKDRTALANIATRWRAVVMTAADAGQDVSVYADPDTIPPARIVAWNIGDPIPGAEGQ